MKKKLLFLSLGALCAIGGIGATFAGDFVCQSSSSSPKTADDGKCAEALSLIDLNVDLQNVVSSFRLPYLGQYSAKISWSFFELQLPSKSQRTAPQAMWPKSPEATRISPSFSRRQPA
jgi:hypothetical protein